MPGYMFAIADDKNYPDTCWIMYRNGKVIYCYYKQWAYELQRRLGAQVSKELGTEYINLTYDEVMNSFACRQTLQEFRSGLLQQYREQNAKAIVDYNKAAPDDDDMEILEHKLTFKDGSSAIAQVKLLAPGLIGRRLFGIHNYMEPWQVYSTAQEATVFTAPNLKVAKKVADKLNELMDWSKIKDVELSKYQSLKDWLNLIGRAAYEGERLPEITPDMKLYVSKMMKDAGVSNFTTSAPNTSKTTKPREEYGDALQGLERLIGLNELKNEFRDVVKKLRGQQKLKSEGIEIDIKQCRHMVFSGPPGTGKTEVAKLMASTLHRLGILKEDKLIVAGRDKLVGMHIGETSEKTAAVIDQAIDGVLFIDEAYSLADGSENDVGKEAVNILIHRMEEHRDNLVVILAGYQSEMEELLAINEGFSSRIPFHFHFKDYTPNELAEIGIKLFESNGLDCIHIRTALEFAISAVAVNGVVPGNARWMRTVVEKSVSNLMIRAGEQDLSKSELRRLQPEDILKAVKLHKQDEDRTGMLELRKVAMDKLHSLVGLSELKGKVTEWVNFLDIEDRKKQKGIFSDKLSMHMMFEGTPGTGKTTVARIVAQILKTMGILENGHLIEVTRSDLVGQYLGQTAPKVKAAVRRAKGGILFIDEAYSLAKDDFGQEAVNQLIREMEEFRDDFILILAGYKDQMKQLMDTNPGFESRIAYRFPFTDYTPIEIANIVTDNLARNKLTMGADSRSELAEQLEIVGGTAKTVNGNGRFARNLVERIRIVQNNRIFNENSEDYETVKPEDIVNAFKALEKVK